MNLMAGVSLTPYYSTIALLVFSIGLVGFLARRNGIVALMCLELMLNGANLALVSFSRLHANTDGSVLVLFVVLVAAAEAATALSIFVALFKRTGTMNLDDFRQLRG